MNKADNLFLLRSVMMNRVTLMCSLPETQRQNDKKNRHKSLFLQKSKKIKPFFFFILYLCPSIFVFINSNLFNLCFFMKSVSRLLWMLMAAVCGLSACEKLDYSQASDETEQQDANSVLQVRTRATATEEGTTVSYPVNVYVFSGEKCVALQTISDEEQTLSLSLTEGSYVVYAVGGATAENYALPTKENATPTMAITLQEGKQHADLMVAKSNVVLVDGGTNVLTLSMERKVMLLQSVTLKNIPSTATAVSVTISPLWEKVVGTAYEGEEGAETIALTKQEDGRTWSFEGAYYLLPPSATSAAMMVNIVKPAGTTSYTYNTAEQLEAGDKINIQGTYTEAVGVTLTGTIAGAVWKDEKTISFEFNESGSKTTEEGNGGDTGGGNGDDTGGGNGDDTGGGTQVSTIPSVGSTYQGCYVLSVSETNGVADVLLLSPKQKKMDFASGTNATQAMSAIEAAMPECAVNGISGWRLITKDEIEIVRQKKNKISGIDTNGRYLYTNASGVLRVGTFGSENVTDGWTFKSGDILLAVAIVKLTTE